MIFLREMPNFFQALSVLIEKRLPKISYQMNALGCKLEFTRIRDQVLTAHETGEN